MSSASSPSSGTNAAIAGKRKRDAPVALQPSSRDASGEETTEPPLNQLHKKGPGLAIETQRKRQRSGLATERSVGSADEEEDEEESSSSVGLGGDAMAAPPVGKLTDPVGYKTNAPPEGRAVRVYADGVFDLFHLGHMRQLEQAKKAFSEVYLIVGVTGDKETHKRKGLTVLSGQERAETVRHCKWVDEVIGNCPWIVTPAFLEEHQIDYVAHDDLPYGADEGDDIYKPIKQAGKFLVTQRTEGVSTTGIITKVVRDYEKYIARQFKRGTSRQELNVSWLKKNELDLKRHVGEIRDSIRNNWTSTGQELGKELQRFWQPSRPASPMRGLSGGPEGVAVGSPRALGHLRERLELPGGWGNGNGGDFATGYSLGLIGGVRSWMTRSRSSNRNSRQDSDDSDADDSDDKSPNDEKSPTRGRTGKASASSTREEGAQA
ncbi:hypothetical protein VC83_08565 [Pseudogymnoascus destructans]|uniref:choline-phosphate cytidylyltransferase n=1 Tax=Pseudogymnoascus destructans TaxID=655981 RepID=A0A177A1Y3_9PEZI|nr:uncharacterized protein VC83_08565 [Pseudogymnoascus destructans]OAF54944.1 hypothetical protein VC83_08565 [Pseudogymnoascus destructans]